jgi:VWFA-related protein
MTLERTGCRVAASAGLAGLLALRLLAGLSAQTKPPQVFKAGVELIVVEANVVDRSGQPVTGLRPNQFDVTLDGKARRVASAELVDLRPAPAAVRPAGQAAAVSRTYYSANTEEQISASSGRLVILAVDQSSFRPGAAMAAVAATRKFLDRLQPADRVGLIAFPPPGPEIAPTTDRGAIREALGNIMGSASPASSLGGPTRFNISVAEALAISDRDTGEFQVVFSRECANLRLPMDIAFCRDQLQMTADSITTAIEMQSQRSLQGFGDVMVAASGIREHKTLVLISAGLITSERPGGRASFAGDVGQLGRIAAASNTNVYVLHFDASFLDAFSAASGTMSQTVFRDSGMAAAGLESIAGSAGGTVFNVASGPEFAFDRIVRETSAYYLLGVEPAEGDRDGKNHRITVSVKLPGVTVRSRREVALPGASAASPSPERAIADALAAARLAPSLPIRLTTTTTARLSIDTCQVLLSADIGDLLPGPVDMKVGFVVTDSSGRLTEPVVASARLAPRASGPPGSVSYMVGLSMKPGTYTVRLAAADPAGRVGSADHRFTVRMTEQSGMSVGDLLLADSSRGPEEAIAPVSDGRLRGTSVVVYVETTPPAGGSVAGVVFGIADTPDGQPLISVAGRLGKSGKSRAMAAESRLDLALLPPGDYFAVATVTDGSKRRVRVSRPFSIERPPEPAGDGAGPHAPVAFSATGSLLKPFNREDVLRPDVLGFFIGRMKQLDPLPLSDSVLRAIEHALAGRFDAVLSELAEANPDQLSVAFMRGVALLSKKDELDPAANQFRAALRAASDFLPAAFYVGACFAAGGKDEHAIGAWQTSLVTESDVRIIYEVLSDAQMRMRDAAAAIDILTEARDRWPDDDGTLPRLGAALAAAGRRDEAMKTLGQYIDRHPEAQDVVFLAIRLIYDARAEGKSLLPDAGDRDLISRYAELYRAASGPNLALVNRWVQFVRQAGEKK